MPNPGDDARRKLLARERSAQLRVISEFQKIEKRLQAEIYDLMLRIDKARRIDGNAPPGLLIRQARARDLLNQVSDEIFRVSQRLGLDTTRLQKAAVDIAQEQAGKYAALRTDLSFFDSPATAELIGIAGDGGALAEHFAGIREPVRQAMFDALFFGIAAGKTNNQISREIRDAVDVGAVRAMTIVRTETNRAYREASRKFYDDAPGVEGWRWVAALDLRTCVTCWALHGRIFPTKTPFGTHPNCRCTMVPVFANDRKTETGPEKFAKLTLEQQRAILGPKRLELYNRGAELANFVETYRSPFGIGRRIIPLDRVSFTEKPRTPAESASGPGGGLFPQSVVRNPDGSLKTMFHGSNSRIEEFDLAKVRPSDLDAPFNGFWFTDNKKNASPALRDPDFLHEVNLDIRNPITRAEIAAMRRADPAVRKMSHSELRLHLQKQGFDGVRWEFRPTIDAKAFAKTGDVTFQTAGGVSRRLVRDPAGGVNLLDADGQFITGYESLEDYLATEFDQEIFVAFRPDQIKIKRIVDLRKKPAELATPTPALPAATIKPGEPLPTFKDAGEATKYLERRFPGTKFDFARVDFAGGFGQAQANEIARLLDEYPEVAERLKYFGTRTDKNKVIELVKGGRMKPSTYAEHLTWRDFRESGIRLNPEVFADAKLMREKKARNLKVGWHVSDADQSTVTHEFGHAVDFWLEFNRNDSLLPFTDARGSVTIESLKKKITRVLKPTPGEQSDYSLRNAREQFAEGFSMFHNRPVAEHSRFARAQARLIELVRDRRYKPAETRNLSDLNDAELRAARKQINELYLDLGLNPPFKPSEL